MSLKVEEHFLVPKHTILPEEEAEKVLKELGIKILKLPRIKKSDPAIKKLKPKKGDVVKITRFSHTAGEAIYYRRVG